MGAAPAVQVYDRPRTRKERTRVSARRTRTA
jgi:hypothetical protein